MRRLRARNKASYQGLHIRIKRMDLLDRLVLVGHQLSQAGILDQSLGVHVRVERGRVDIQGTGAAEIW